VGIWNIHRTPEKVTLLGHTASIGTVEFSPDGKHLLSSGNDGEVKIWDSQTGQLLRTLQPFEQFGGGVAYSADGRLAVTTDYPHVTLWDTRTWRSRAVLNMDDFGCRVHYRPTFSPDGKYLAASGAGIAVWSLDALEEGATAVTEQLPKLLIHIKSGDTRVVRFSPDGRLLAGIGDREVKAWKVPYFEEISNPAIPALTNENLAFYPDGRHVAYPASDGTVVTWDLEKDQLAFLIGSPGTFRGRHIALSTDGRLLAAESDSAQVSVWNTQTRRQIATLPSGRGSVWCLAWSPVSRCLAVGRSDGEVVIWNISAVRDQLEPIGLAWPDVPPPAEPPNSIIKDPLDNERRRYIASVYSLRAGQHAEKSEWEKAKAECRRATELHAGDYRPWYKLALCHLATGNVVGYREACHSMIEQFHETDDPATAQFVAWSCALAPNAVDDYEPVLASANKAVEAQPDSDQSLNTGGAVLHRAGYHHRAIERLTELDRRRETRDRAGNSSPAYTWYFLAMARQKAGNAEQARDYLNKANQWTDEVLADEEDPPAWNRRATLELLRGEAEALLGGDTHESAESGHKPNRQTSTKPKVESDIHCLRSAVVSASWGPGNRPHLRKLAA
jgi:tetratricopeptide (TPR) repeat protein